MANMAAGLNQANFTQAQAAATGDIPFNRTLQADTSNQTSQQNRVSRSNLQAQMSNQGANAADIQRALQAQQSEPNRATANKIQLRRQRGERFEHITGQNMGQLANNAYTMQNQAGGEQMAQSQDQINAQMQKFQQAWGYPTQQLGVLQSALGMTPYGQSTTGASDTQTYHADELGHALAGAPASARSARSSKASPTKRLKKNVQKLGVHAPTKTPIYAFNWKGEPPGAPKSMGPMAQDLAKTVPGSVMKHPRTGVLHVHPAVLGAMARPAPAGTLGAMAMGKPVHQMLTQHRRRIRPPIIHGALAGG